MKALTILTKPLVALVALFACQSSFAAVAFVQKTARFIADNASSAVSASLTMTAGNLVVVPIAWYDASVEITSVTDGTNSYTVVGDSENANANSAIAYAHNVAAGSRAVTVNFSGATYVEAVVAEFSGIVTSLSFDEIGINGNSPAVTSLTATTAGATDTADELVVAILAVTAPDNDVNISSPPATSYISIELQDDAETRMGLSAAYKIISGTGIQSAAWTFEAVSSASATIATFRAAAGGGGGLVCNPISGRCGTVAPPIITD